MEKLTIILAIVLFTPFILFCIYALIQSVNISCYFIKKQKADKKEINNLFNLKLNKLKEQRIYLLYKSSKQMLDAYNKGLLPEYSEKEILDKYSNKAIEEKAIIINKNFLDIQNQLS
jgi:hypothetical protein